MSPSKDFHLVGKSSSRFGEKRTNLCNAHQNGLRCRRSTTSVACQTDQTEEYSVIVPSSVASSKVTTPEPATTSTASDGVLRLMIQNFRNMTDTVRGPNKRIQGVNWRIMVMPRQHVVQKKGTQKCLGFFLQCCPEAYSDAWSCQASAELRLISQRAGIPHFTRKTNHGYTAKENDWGYSCFMTWADILDESQGYIKDDRVILEVSVKAEPPKNIL
uniref:MATH domain-containing protein n=1 Tax=Heterorhabditis bacteriophora TaxID=37862 RepID=A0A1I7WD64_HETBA